ncbi:hypothetical protein TPENAI_60873 [Tenacibaculum litopenaei]|uniref:hypothetical protein n=1 Tax=Tenacibaculum litopenaei TaxID=396016 RepID=UPI00389531BC
MINAPRAIEFADWINNNWFIPTGTDLNWELNKEHPEFELTIEENEVNLYTTEELYVMFENLQGVF